MQSYRQHRLFESRAREQYLRDKGRAEVVERANEEIASQQAQSGLEKEGRLSEDLSQTASPSLEQEEEKGEEEEGHRPGSIESLPLAEADAGGEVNVVEDADAIEIGSESEPDEERDGAGLDRNPTTATLEPTKSFGTRLGHALTGIEVRVLSPEVARKRRRRLNKRLGLPVSGSGDEEEGPIIEKVFVVDYESDGDDLNPQNWSFIVRSASTMLIAAIGFIVGFASSVDSAVLPQAAADLGVSQVTESLATAVFLIGLGFGSLFSGPVSEAVGRNPVYLVSMVVYMAWILGAALAPDIGGQIVFRFLAGFCTAAPMTCAGGSLSDLWTPMERVVTFPMFAIAAFGGPVAGPLVGGFIADAAAAGRASWRWCEWVTLIASGVILVIICLFQPETYKPVLMKWKASHLRRITGDERYVSEMEIRAHGFGKRLLLALYRPFVMFAREPTVVLFALYLTIVYIILFTFLDGYTYVYGETYGFSRGLTGLAFLGILVGIMLAGLLVPIFVRWAKRDLRHLQGIHGPSARLPPEIRLWYAMIGGPCIPISLFWMGWTNYSNISPWSDLIASVPFGFGIICIFISSYQYIIDSYETYAASALVGLTLLRYTVSGSMVVVGIPFYRNMGVHNTLTILGSISAIMVPVPFAFYKFGPKIRSWSKFATDKY